MNAVAEITPTLDVGFYAGKIAVDGIVYALIVAPKAEGEHAAIAWNGSYDSVPGALSWNDGIANTRAMADAGSKLAQWARSLTIGGHKDWYLPSLDELELCYRAFKPTTEKNWLYARSGINVSAVPPTYPYAADLPAQTQNELFRVDGREAFEAEAYWSSTQHADGSAYAWGQYFDDGNQGYWGKDLKLRARAVRRLPI